MPTSEVAAEQFHVYGVKRVSYLGVKGTQARVEIPGRIFSVSKIDGEADWTIDGEFLSNGLPIFFNGTFSRITRRRVVIAADIVRTLNERSGS